MSEETAQGAAVVTEEPSFAEYKEFREKGELAAADSAESTTSEADEAQTDGGTETPAKQDGEPKGERRKPDAERRIAQLTRQRRDAEARAEALERQLSELRQAKPEPKPEMKEPVRPKVTDFEDYEAYEQALDKYHEQVIDWKLHQRLASDSEKQTRDANQARAQEHQDELAQRWAEQSAAARKKHEDFDEVLEDATQNLPAHLIQAVFESDTSVELAYYLATHPDELASIAEMTPIKAVKALGLIENKLPPSTAKPKTSKAPPPATPVGGGGKSAVSLESATDFATYKRLRRQQEQQAA